MTSTVASPGTHPVSPRDLAWLERELAAWAGEGLVDDTQVAAIRARYRPTHAFSLATLVLTLGAAFVGVGLIWLVASNLDELAPLWRFLVVATFWLLFTLGAEWLAGRREHGGTIPSPVVGAARLLAALVFGAVVFQAAQSLQVPAYEPKLVGLWALGALVHAYAVRGLMPLLVGTVGGTVWLVWQAAWDTSNIFAVVLAFVIGGVIAVAVAVVHRGAYADFAPPWREAGALLLLVGLFIAAIPDVDTEGFDWTWMLVVGCVVAGLAAVAAAAAGRGWARVEPLAAVAVALLAVGLAVWQPGSDPDNLNVGDWAHAALAVVSYLLVAAAVAALGVVHDSWRLTFLATAGIVVFTTFQSFAVFARILPGATLFVVLGVVFLGTGYLADRGRRQLAVSLEGEES
ncbi:MAG: DUF2157 domain-containing protein [Nocardioidaceae bacterium]